MRRKLLLPLALAGIGAFLLTASAFAGSSGTSAATQKGGTLRLNISNGDFEFVDPGLAYDTTSWTMLYATQSLLVNYPEKPGIASSKLYPEAAEAFPVISKDGKTYTFTIRKGLRFSDGSPVTAASFRRALERNLSPEMGSPLGVNDQVDQIIQGGKAFVDGKAKTLSGVSAQGQKLTIRLTKPTPTFLAILAMQWYGAVKADMPYTDRGLDVYPSAGPYYIKSREVGRSLVLARNPNYKGSRPANPDQIVFTVNTDQAQSLLQVKSGDADFDLGGHPPAENEPLAAQFGVNKGRYFVGPNGCVLYYAMNTSRAPFNSLQMRKAAEWAIDRPALIRVSGKFAGKRTDQILVPGVPGFKDYKLYALKGADLAKAKQLAGSVGGREIVLYHGTSSLQTSRAQVVKFNMEQLGFDVRTRPTSASVYYKTLGTRGNDFDIGYAGWCADYNDPFDFINVLLDGRTIQAENNTNYAYYNNAALNRKMDAAAAQFGDARANAYSKLDLEIMRDHAPWVPFMIPNSRMFVSARVKNFIFVPYYTLPALHAMVIAG
ncbi:MAG: ABC transporter substrate-binding protein [Gaiella sp.]